MWQLFAGSAITLVTGFVSAWGTNYWTRKARREDREADVAQRSEERAEARRIAEADRVRDVYKRAIQVAADFRWLSEWTNTHDQWKVFLPRLHEVRAELALHGSEHARAAFDAYLTHIEESEYIKTVTNEPSDDYWSFLDRDIELLVSLAREDLAELLEDGAKSPMSRENGKLKAGAQVALSAGSVAERQR